jgi:hypothetical protein
MVLYNVTVIIDHNHEQEWLQWMEEKHIPDVMDTKHFLECRISAIQAEDQGGQSYAITYLSESQEKLDYYMEHLSPALQDEHNKKFGGKFAAFRTIMKVKNEFKLS